MTYLHISICTSPYSYTLLNKFTLCVPVLRCQAPVRLQVAQVGRLRQPQAPRKIDIH